VERIQVTDTMTCPNCYAEDLASMNAFGLPQDATVCVTRTRQRDASSNRLQRRCVELLNERKMIMRWVCDSFARPSISSDLREEP
jgi:hypothetical protein